MQLEIKSVELYPAPVDDCICAVPVLTAIGRSPTAALMPVPDSEVVCM